MNPTSISLRLLGRGFDAEEIDRMTRGLRAEILEIDVEDVRTVRTDEIPAGAKSAETIAIGALVVAAAPVVIQSLMSVVSSWLSRQPAELEIEIDGKRIKGPFTKEERNRLVGAYLRSIDDQASTDDDRPGPVAE